MRCFWNTPYCRGGWRKVRVSRFIEVPTTGSQSVASKVLCLLEDATHLAAHLVGRVPTPPGRALSPNGFKGSSPLPRAACGGQSSATPATIAMRKTALQSPYPSVPQSISPLECASSLARLTSRVCHVAFHEANMSCIQVMSKFCAVLETEGKEVPLPTWTDVDGHQPEVTLA